MTLGVAEGGPATNSEREAVVMTIEKKSEDGIDDAVDKAKKVGEKAKDLAQKATDKVKEVAKKVGDKVEEVSEKVGEKVEEAGQKLRGNGQKLRDDLKKS